MPKYHFEKLEPRNEIPVKNKYELSSLEGYDVVASVYYIEEHVFKVIIRRMDSPLGWVSCSLTLYDIGGVVKRSISISGTNEENCHIGIYNTDIKLVKTVIEPQVIPRIIVQTSENSYTENLLEYNSVMSVIEANPEYKYIHCDKIERRRIIKQIPMLNLLEAYDTLVPGAFKADLFRYCYLYLYGGVYIDLKMISRAPLRNTIKNNDDVLVCENYEISNSMERGHVESYSNCFIACLRNSPYMETAIRKCIENIIERRSYFDTVTNSRNANLILDLTGPGLLYRSIASKIMGSSIRAKLIITDPTFPYQPVKPESYKMHTVVNLDTQEEIFTISYPRVKGADYYEYMWHRGEVFYKNRVDKGRYSFYVYPNPYPDSFDYDIEGGELTVSRNEGWGQNLRIRVLNNEEDTEEIVEVGASDKNYKKVRLTGIIKKSG